MTIEQKQREYHKLASKMLDYIWGCAQNRVAPLKHDANLFSTELEHVRSLEVRR